MLIMPIGNGKNVVNVKVSLKNKNLISKGTFLQSLNESEIIVGNRKFSTSGYYERSNEYSDIVSFIRHFSLISGNDTFTVTTREEKGSTLYDVYSVSIPEKHVNEGLDLFFGAIVSDLRRTIPDSLKGRDISLKKFGVLEDLDKKRMKDFRIVVDGNRDFSEFEDLINTLEFLKMFDFEIMEDSVVTKELLEYQLESLKPCATDTYKKLSKYYKTALDNEDVYRKLVYIHRSIYNKPYNLIHKSKAQEKIKLKERLYDKAA